MEATLEVQKDPLDFLEARLGFGQGELRQLIDLAIAATAAQEDLWANGSLSGGAAQ